MDWFTGVVIIAALLLMWAAGLWTGWALHGLYHDLKGMVQAFLKWNRNRKEAKR